MVPRYAPPMSRLTPGAALRAGAAALVLCLTCWAALGGQAQTSQPAAVKWAWSGGVTARSAIVTARVTRPGATVHLSVTRADRAAAGVRTLQAAADGDGAVSFPLGGLDPATPYEYRVSLDGAASLTGTFRTFGEGPWSFRLAFSACADTGSQSPVFDAIRAADPALFLHLGDFHYEDISRSDPAAYRRAYDAVLGSPAQGRLYRSVPIAYTWDDHDFGANNANSTSRSRPVAQAAYRQLVPHYPLADGEAGGIHQAFDMGRVRVIVTDSRSYRTSSRGDRQARTILGARQRQWLKDELTAAAGAPLVVWANSVPWIAGATSGRDHWGSYALEREEIANHIASLGLGRRLIMLSGDAHMVALDDGTNSNYATGAGRDAPGFVVAHAAPLDRQPSSKGGPYSHGISRQRGQFGLLEVTDAGRTLRAEVSGRDRRGAPIRGVQLALVCEQGRCDVQR